MADIANPILLDIPGQLETERLWLRSVRPDDASIINAGIQESLPQLRRWMHWARRGQTLEETQIFIRESAARFIRRESLGFSIWRKTDKQYVGGCSLFNFNWDVPSGEIGYWQRATMQGHGYVTEAVNRLTQFAFETLGLQRVEIRCEGANQRSAAVALRAGYRLEARLRNHRRNPLGELADTLVHAKIATDR